MRTWNDSIWFSPCYAIYNFRKLVDTIGVENAFKNKRELEAYVASIALLAVNHSTIKHWWVQIPQQDPPDALTATMSVNEDKMGVLNIQEIEVFRIEDHLKETIVEATKRKLHNKAYDPKTVLVGLINRDEEIKDINDIHLELTKIGITISTIWLLGNKNVLQDKYIVFEVFPKVQAYEISIPQECEAIKHVGHMMRVHRSTANASVTKVKITGDNVPLLIPDGQY